MYESAAQVKVPHGMGLDMKNVLLGNREASSPGTFRESHKLKSWFSCDIRLTRLAGHPVIWSWSSIKPQLKMTFTMPIPRSHSEIPAFANVVDVRLALPLRSSLKLMICESRPLSEELPDLPSSTLLALLVEPSSRSASRLCKVHPLVHRH